MTPISRTRALLEDRLERLSNLGVPFPQSADEFGVFCHLLHSLAQTPVSYLEIGCRHGGSLFVAAAFLPPGSTLIALDLPGAAWGISSSEVELQHVAAALTAEGYQAHVLLLDSQSRDAKSQVESILDGRDLDAIFIDADHTLAGATADWECYRGLVRDGGLVAFHDIADRADTPDVEVHRLWSTLRSTYPYFEVVFEYGIGALWLRR